MPFTAYDATTYPRLTVDYWECEFYKYESGILDPSLLGWSMCKVDVTGAFRGLNGRGVPYRGGAY